MTDQAVVLGGGIAGLLSAAVMAGEFDEVAVVERDRLPDSPIGRRGIPQGPHLHSVLAKGWQVIEDLLPGFRADLAAAGAVMLDDESFGTRVHMQNGPYTFNRTDPISDPAALALYLATRPMVEFQLRRRVAALPNVTVRDGHDVCDFVAAQPHRITGVSVRDRQSGVGSTLRADLVVDATGRASRTPRLLENLGYTRPPHRSFTVRGVYYSQQITIPDQDTFPERLILVLPQGSTGRGGLVAGENDTWTLTAAGRTHDGVAAPSSFADMLALAAQFVPPHILPALKRARPLTDVAVYHYPGGIWHRYEQQAHHPDGLLVVGDALCCLDPVFGQGITMAALHAAALRAELRGGTSVGPERFHRSLASVIAPVWAANQPAGRTPARSSRHRVQRRVIDWSQRMILESADDIVVTERLYRVGNMIDPPQRLLEPALLARVAAHHTRRPWIRLRRRRGAPKRSKEW
ncbi:FAD-dependent oxidoreductase [Mycobacterium sp. CPCC 205372]|uniref:FAD-dependent oxidoreductase n=1 Tax=Mycobacterium hippophais TaxID=3016340 RepID=A0ABT4PUP8_9MYCO|nr:FAD-dependent oxidoreductase [Mycobacterium hippophais]MCZ8380214.1 FAD-dependent oxidoreductase [Mycobacterium hippophais]